MPKSPPSLLYEKTEGIITQSNFKMGVQGSYLYRPSLIVFLMRAA